MHSVANLATLQNPLATFFFLKKSAQTLFSLRVLPRERKVLLSQHAHTPLSLSLRLSAQFLFSKRTHISLSPRLLSFGSASAHTSFSLSASAQFRFSVRTHIFLSLCICSVSVQRAHTHLSLSLSASAQFLFSERTHISLSLSLHLLRFCSVRGREEQSLIQLNTDIMLLASLILHASIAKITAQQLSLPYGYFI